MTCTHCCGADQLFDKKGADKEMKKYKKRGPGKVTKQLIAQISEGNDFYEKSLLDIGGGIGAIQWAFLDRGGIHAIAVDASNNYQKVARFHAENLGYEKQVSFIFGDFVNISREIGQVDFVTMDKVLCCYPDYQSLLGAALEKCKEGIAISYPIKGIISQLFVLVENAYFKLRNIAFRTYLHSPAEIENFIKTRGFEITHKGISFPWHVQVYRRFK